MILRCAILALAVLLAPARAAADPRLVEPRPDMSDADLRKSCSGEAGRVYRPVRGTSARGYAAVEYNRSLRRDYRKECIRKVKLQRRGRTAGAGADRGRRSGALVATG